MRFLKGVFNILRNRYLLAITGFIVWMLFFEPVKDVFSQIERKKELEMLNKKISYYKNEIKLARKQQQELEHNPATLERFAREKYFMKKDNEEVFVIEEDKGADKYKGIGD
jgi:cell division protein DivIC